MEYSVEKTLADKMYMYSYNVYREISNIMHTKFQKLNVSRLIL